MFLVVFYSKKPGNFLINEKKKYRKYFKKTLERFEKFS